MDEEKRQEINNVVLENFMTLVKDANGICVLKKFISTNKSEKIKADIYKEIQRDLFNIMKNPFGNYIVQMIIEVLINYYFNLILIF